MGERPQRVYTIASDAPFLDILAKAVLRGFPYAEGHQHPSLAAWTILVPTRRAARELQEKLLVESGKPALVLPQIRPIGDLDEDVLEAQRPYVGLPDAISDIGREFALMALIDDLGPRKSAASPGAGTCARRRSKPNPWRRVSPI